MPDTVDLKALLKLSASERAKIVSLLWESLEEEGAAAILHEQQYADAERRLAELKSSPERGLTHDQVRAMRGWSK